MTDLVSDDRQHEVWAKVALKFSYSLFLLITFFFYKVLKSRATLSKYSVTRKYPLRGYILGVLMHTTAWDRHWGGDETLKLVLVYVA